MKRKACLDRFSLLRITWYRSFSHENLDVDYMRSCFLKNCFYEIFLFHFEFEADPDVFSSLKPRWKIHGEIRNESSSAVKVTSKRSAKRRLFPPRTIHIAQTTFPVGDISKTEMGNGQSFFNQLSED